MTNLPPTIALSLLLALPVTAAEKTNRAAIAFKKAELSYANSIIKITTSETNITATALKEGWWGWLHTIKTNRPAFLVDSTAAWKILRVEDTPEGPFQYRSRPDIELNVPITLTLITNWTGVTFKDRELGYIATNHVAEVVYLGETNHFTLRTDASEVATWRTQQTYTNIIFTNGWSSPLIISTNIWHFNAPVVSP